VSPTSRQSRLLSLFLHPTMVDDGVHLPVEFHNSNYGKDRWEIYWVRLLQVVDAHQHWEQILSLAFPGRPLSFRNCLETCNRTNERTIRLRFKLHILPLYFLVWFMLLWESWVTDKLKEVREQSDKVEVHCVIKQSYDYGTVRIPNGKV